MEVQRFLSEAPHFRSSISHPIADLGGKYKCYPMNKPMAKTYNEKIAYEIEISTILGQGAPSFRKRFRQALLPQS